MKTEKFSLFRAYEIKCRRFFEEGMDATFIVVGVHGFAGDKDSSMLKRLARRVTEAGGELVCFDFPSHGESPVGEDMLTTKNCIEDLARVCGHAREKYPLCKKAIFATSFGGYVSILAREQLSDFTYVLRAPAVTMPKILTETVLKIPREEFSDLGVIECGFERKMNLPFSFLTDLESQPSAESCHIDSPFLVIHGDADDVVPPEDVFTFCEKQECSVLEIIKGADHRFKNPGEIDAVIEKTMDFLENN